MKQMSINSGGPFAFILELDKLTTMTSPTFIGRHYVVQGDPTSSLIHSRYSPGGGMPPASVTQRPSPADLVVLDDWITRCIDDPDSPGGWPPFVATRWRDADGRRSVTAARLRASQRVPKRRLLRLQPVRPERTRVRALGEPDARHAGSARVARHVQRRVLSEGRRRRGQRVLRQGGRTVLRSGSVHGVPVFVPHHRHDNVLAMRRDGRAMLQAQWLPGW